MMRVIIIDTPKGQYSLPLLPVAQNRADYYATEVDGHEKGSQEWHSEVNYVMKADPFEGIDWLLNNSDWEDWENQATKINDKVNVTDNDFWRRSDGLKIKESDVL